MKLTEVQIDRLVGPTHHFGGIGVGNVASQTHGGQRSNPAAAALQGLAKMRLVAGMGVPQVILPPQRRPHLVLLRSLGFSGSDADVLRRSRDEAPELLSAAMSCSAMWTANAATVTPGIDSDQASATLTIANLVASVHRALEPDQTMMDLRRCLPSPTRLFASLPGGAALRDEGAANHMRLGTDDNQRGINVFVHGDFDPKPQRFWPRQSLAACQAIARQHQLPVENTFFLKQHPAAIDAGAFHNDVVALSHQQLLIHHQLAFSHGHTLERLDERFLALTGKQLIRIEVSNEALSLQEAIETYLFNSQIVSSSSGDEPRWVILCPAQVREHVRARKLVDDWCQQGLFARAHFVDLNQSMSGGGGPACLRLRVPLAEDELAAIPTNALWNEEIDEKLCETIKECYVEELSMDDLARIDFCEQAEHAHDRVVSQLCDR